MMRFSNLITIIIVVVSCSSTRQIQLPAYNITDSFKAFLDTVIYEESKCVYYDNEISAFSISISKKNDSLIDIKINSEFEDTYNYNDCIGAFEYKNHIFFCSGIINEEILKPNNNKISIESKYDKINHPEGVIDEYFSDRYSSWRYEYFDNNFKCVYHFPCTTQE